MGRYDTIENTTMDDISGEVVIWLNQVFLKDQIIFWDIKQTLMQAQDEAERNGDANPELAVEDMAHEAVQDKVLPFFKEWLIDSIMDDADWENIGEAILQSDGLKQNPAA